VGRSLIYARHRRGANTDPWGTPVVTDIFVDCDPFLLPDWLIKLLTKGRVLCLFGPHRNSVTREDESLCLARNCREGEDAAETNEDDASLSSMESDAEDEEYKMKIIARGDGTLRCVKLEEYGAWNFENTSN
jgi:hypothetical protein